MSVLIAYESVEGQTAKIAEFVAGIVRARGLEVSLVNLAERAAAVSFDGVETVILAAPVHERRHPPAFETFVAAGRKQLADRRVMMLSVSLSAAFPGVMEDAQDYLVEMEMRTGMTPDREVLVAGAIRTASYGYFETQVLRHNVLAGKGIDPDDGPREFTDWEALEAEVAAFLGA